MWVWVWERVRVWVGAGRVAVRDAIGFSCREGPWIKTAKIRQYTSSRTEGWALPEPEGACWPLFDCVWVGVNGVEWGSGGQRALSSRDAIPTGRAGRFGAAWMRSQAGSGRRMHGRTLSFAMVAGRKGWWWWWSVWCGVCV